MIDVITFLSGIGFIYEYISRIKARDRYLPQGELVDVGGHKLHYLSRGSGGPTVVFESGLDPAGHLTWFKVQEEVSKHTTTISYDRAGILWSERGDNPKTCEAISQELYTLLNKSGAKKPYILVGHSLAGLTLRHFANKYPQDIAGLVFVDVSHPEQRNVYSKELKFIMTNRPPDWVIQFANSTGMMRLFSKTTAYPNTDQEDRVNILTRELYYKGLPATLEEFANLDDLLKEAAQLNDLGNIPLKVITGSAPDRFKMLPTDKLRNEMSHVWHGLQKELLNLSSNSRQIQAPKSGHHVQLEQPELVIEAIKEFIKKTQGILK